MRLENLQLLDGSNEDSCGYALLQITEISHTKRCILCDYQKPEAVCESGVDESLLDITY